MRDYNPLHTYRLVVFPDPGDDPRTVEFDADSAEAALHRAQRLCHGREVELFEDGRSLGRVRCEDGGYWSLSESPRPGAGSAP